MAAWVEQQVTHPGATLVLGDFNAVTEGRDRLQQQGADAVFGLDAKDQSPDSLVHVCREAGLVDLWKKNAAPFRKPTP